MLTYNRSLSKTRRKRPIPDGWATGDVIQEFQLVESSQSLCSGATALSVDQSGELALFGGSDGAGGLFSLTEKRVIASLSVDGAITDTAWVGQNAAIATSTGVVKIFDSNGNETASFSSHAGAVTALAGHPTGDILASVGVDKSYVMYDLTTNAAITQVFSDAGKLKSKSHIIRWSGADPLFQGYHVSSSILTDTSLLPAERTDRSKFTTSNLLPKRPASQQAVH